MTLAEQADAATTRDALAAAARLIRRTDLLIAATLVEVHGSAHLRPVADRLMVLADCLASALADSTSTHPERYRAPGGTP